VSSPNASDGATPALLEDFVAIGDVLVVRHEIDAESGAFHRINGSVHVGSDATQIVAADGSRPTDEIVKLRCLAYQVDAARRIAGAVVAAVRPLDDFDRLEVEQVVAAVLQAVAEAVDVDVVAGIESAHADEIARTRATLAHLHGDAGHVAQRIAQSECTLIEQQLFRQHRDGLRCIDERLRVFGRRRLFRLVTVDRLTLDDHA
jgi:hypothetical protein